MMLFVQSSPVMPVVVHIVCSVYLLQTDKVNTKDALWCEEEGEEEVVRSGYDEEKTRSARGQKCAVPRMLVRAAVAACSG